MKSVIITATLCLLLLEGIGKVWEESAWYRKYKRWLQLAVLVLATLVCVAKQFSEKPVEEVVRQAIEPLQCQIDDLTRLIGSTRWRDSAQLPDPAHDVADCLRTRELLDSIQYTAVEKGLIAIGLSDYSVAREHLNYAVAAAAGDRVAQAEALFYMGVIGILQGDYHQALTSFSSSLECDSDPSDTWYNHGLCLLRLDEYVQAEHSFEQAVDRDPADADGWHNLGVTRNNQGRYKDAIPAFRRAVRLRPLDAESQASLGHCLAQVDRHSEAVAVLSIAVRLDPENGLAWMDKGLSERALGESVAGMESLTTASHLCPDSALVWYNLGNVQFELGHKPAALASYVKAAGLNPRHSLTWSNMGAVYLDLDSLPLAQTAFLKALTVDSSCKPAKMGLREVNLRLDNKGT